MFRYFAFGEIKVRAKTQPRCHLIFAEVSFRVRNGAPEVRSLRKFGANLYRRTPQGKQKNNQRYLSVAFERLAGLKLTISHAAAVHLFFRRLPDMITMRPRSSFMEYLKSLSG